MIWRDRYSGGWMYNDWCLVHSHRLRVQMLVRYPFYASVLSQGSSIYYYIENIIDA